MGFIAIDFDQLVLVTVFAFAAIGLSRGWLAEFINTVLLVLLSILLVKPEMLEPILKKLNEILKLLWAIFSSGVDLGKALTAYKEMDHIIDPSNPYPFLLILTIVLLAMQYAPTTDRISNLVYMAPFLNLIIVSLVLDEQIYMTTIYGIVLLVLGVLIQNMIGRHAKTT